MNKWKCHPLRIAFNHVIITMESIIIIINTDALLVVMVDFFVHYLCYRGSIITTIVVVLVPKVVMEISNIVIIFFDVVIELILNDFSSSATSRNTQIYKFSSVTIKIKWKYKAETPWTTEIMLVPNQIISTKRRADCRCRTVPQSRELIGMHKEREIYKQIKIATLQSDLISVGHMVFHWGVQNIPITFSLWRVLEK